MLGGGVDRLAGSGDEARERDDVDDVTPARRPHQLQRGQRAVHGAHRVDLEHEPPAALVVLPRAAGHEHAGVVDPDLQRAGPLRRHRGGGAAGGLVADVEHGREGAIAQLGGGARRRLAVDVGHMDRVSAGREHPCDLEPEPAAGAGDERAAAGS